MAVIQNLKKTAFKLFDFFAQLRILRDRIQLRRGAETAPVPATRGQCEDRRRYRTGCCSEPAVPTSILGEDILSQASSKVDQSVSEGMRIDRMFFDRFADDCAPEDETISQAVEAGQWDLVIDYVNREVFDKPEEFYTLDKLRKAAAVDRRLTLREILEKVFGLIPHFKSKDELLEEEFAKFVADYKPRGGPKSIPAIKTYFKAYVANAYVKRQH